MVSLAARFCNQCGSPVEEGDRYCEHCGSPIRGSSRQDPAAVVGPPSEPITDTKPTAVPSAPEPPKPKSQWERVFGEGGAAEKTIAEQERRHEAVFGPSKSAIATSRPPLPGARTNGTAVASLILALIGMIIGSVLAVILGYQAQREIDRSEGTQTGRGLATAGIVIGWISLAAWVLILVAVAFASPNLG
jgi:hypothetical protein